MTHHPIPTDLCRILDAEANRAAEGLRVVEDYLRFVLDDRHLTSLAKNLRHDLTAVLGRFELRDRLASRESTADVGATLATPAESVRTDARSVAAASFKRVQQALRSLEEHSKPIDPTVAAEIERLRFATYTLEQAAGITADSLDRLAAARLCLLVDGRGSESEFATLVQSLVDANAPMLQLRDKQLPDRTLLSRARQLRQITRGKSTLFIMNDRPDVAALADADGVHVGQDELTVKDARSIVGPRALVGVSTHSIEQARRAVLDGANYIGVGPTFPSGTKPFESYPGVDLLAAVAAEIRLPTFAIGGITLANLPQVLAAGIQRVAVAGAITGSKDPRSAVHDFTAHLHP